MKAYRFELKEVSEDQRARRNPQAAPTVQYADLLDAILYAPPVMMTPNGPVSQGITTAEQRERNRLRRMVQEADGVLHLTPQEYEFLRRLVQSHLWGAATFVYDQFIADLEACPQVEMTESTVTKMVPLAHQERQR